MFRSLSTSKRKERTPNSVVAHILLDTPVGANTPLKRCVKFGSASAAEFEKDDPPQGSLTPMPPTKAAQRFPTDMQEPDRKTADWIAMTKENSATLAEWDYFDDGEDDLLANDGFRSPNEHRRSRRESGRFLPFCETDVYETIQDDALAMETSEIEEDGAIEKDVGKTFETDAVRVTYGVAQKTKAFILTYVCIVHGIDSGAGNGDNQKWRGSSCRNELDGSPTVCKSRHKYGSR